MSEPQRGISAFFPAFNEEDNIDYVISSALSLLKTLSDKYEVIIVLYESSTDKTDEIVKAWVAKDEHVKLVYQKKDERGYGVAMKLGYESARFDRVFYSDADRQFDIRQLKSILPFVDYVDMIAGYRRHRKDPVMRKIASKVYNIILRVLFGLEERDIDCAFKLCKKSIFDKVTLNCKTGLADAELLLKTQLNGYQIIEYGVKHFPRIAGGTYFSGFMNIPKPQVVFNILKEIKTLHKETKVSRQKIV